MILILGLLLWRLDLRHIWRKHQNIIKSHLAMLQMCETEGVINQTTSRPNTLAEREVGEKKAALIKMRNLLYLILFYCIYQSSTLDDDLEYFQKTPDEEMNVKPLHQAQLPNLKMGNDNIQCRGNVSFDVECTSHVKEINKNIIFDKINFKTANASFNTTSGKFKCNIPGIYFFSFSVLPTRGTQTDVVLMKNNETISKIHSVLGHNTSQLAVKNTIINLSVNDTVSVLLEKGNLWSGVSSISFQGFLICPSK